MHHAEWTRAGNFFGEPRALEFDDRGPEVFAEAALCVEGASAADFDLVRGRGLGEVDPDVVALTPTVDGEGKSVPHLGRIRDIAGAKILTASHQGDTWELADAALLKSCRIVGEAGRPGWPRHHTIGRSRDDFAVFARGHGG